VRGSRRTYGSLPGPFGTCLKKSVSFETYRSFENLDFRLRKPEHLDETMSRMKITLDHRLPVPNPDPSDFAL
jgi:hypothetical protein